MNNEMMKLDEESFKVIEEKFDDIMETIAYKRLSIGDILIEDGSELVELLYLVKTFVDKMKRLYQISNDEEDIEKNELLINKNRIERIVQIIETYFEKY